MDCYDISCNDRRRLDVLRHSIQDAELSIEEVLDALIVTQLRNLCFCFGLSVTGNRHILIERLNEFLGESSGVAGNRHDEDRRKSHEGRQKGNDSRNENANGRNKAGSRASESGYLIPEDMLRRFLHLCHPDKHHQSEVSNVVTQWLLEYRRKVFGN